MFANEGVPYVIVTFQSLASSFGFFKTPPTKRSRAFQSGSWSRFWTRTQTLYYGATGMTLTRQGTSFDVQWNCYRRAAIDTPRLVGGNPKKGGVSVDRRNRKFEGPYVVSAAQGESAADLRPPNPDGWTEPEV